MKLLYLGEKITDTSGGAEVINKRNQILLEEICGSIEYFSIKSKGLLSKFYFGITDDVLKRLYGMLEEGKITHVFIPQSLMGRAASYISKNFPKIKIITFYHNVEIDYAKAYLKNTGIKALPFYFLTRKWELCTTKYSSVHITLNERDRRRLKECYGIDSDINLPTSMNDSYSLIKESTDIPYSVDYLFVGLAFYANIHGIKWFIQNVFPEIDGNLVIVGNGMDKVFSNLNNERIHVYGFTKDLSPFYRAAKKVISPIFIGAGMKTKTAEALMWGKYIVGTSEAFEGYQIDDRFMKVCLSKDGFITALSIKNNSFIPEARDLFLKKYHTPVLKNMLSKLLTDL